MKNWKKTLAVSLALCLLLLTTAACGSGTAKKEDPAAAKTPAEETAAAKTPAEETAAAAEKIEYWTADSPAMASIIEAVDNYTDPDSENYLEPEERIALFDMDGTLIGELFPTYFDQCLLMYRVLHDDSFDSSQVSAEDREYLQALETALLNGEEEPDYPKSSAQIAAEAFKGFTVEEYRAYVRSFMDQPVAGFEGMTYGQVFYKPMAALVRYLDEHDFRVYINSGAERSLARELSEDTLGEWIPPYQVVGTTFSLTATGQGDTAGRDYTYTAEDQVLLEGNMTFKNVKMNKVVSTIDEIGVIPALVFGNSSGDFAMAQYAVQNGGRAYMLLCDDTERDYGDTEKAESFKKKCEELGFETVSMKNEFETIYGENVKKTGFQPADQAEPAEEAEDTETAAPENAPAEEAATSETAVPANQTPAEEPAPEEELAPAA